MMPLPWVQQVQQHTFFDCLASFNPELKYSSMVDVVDVAFGVCRLLKPWALKLLRPVLLAISKRVGSSASTSSFIYRNPDPGTRNVCVPCQVELLRPHGGVGTDVGTRAWVFPGSLRPLIPILYTLDVESLNFAWLPPTLLP